MTLPRPIGLRRIARAFVRRLVRFRSASESAGTSTALAEPGSPEYTARYRAWMARHQPTAAGLAQMRETANSLTHQPLISVITPVYNTDARWLRACIESVRRQAYPRWELCVCDDASTSADTRAVLAECAGDPRIRLVRLDRNAHISAASNAALSVATGEFVALLDHDDELTPDALYEVVRHLIHKPDADVLYSDEDKLDPDGGYSEPYFKPDWSPEHLLSAMYTCHLTVARRALVEQVGKFRVGYEGSQDHDLALRLSEMTSRIHHVPKVLYHWRRVPQSTASRGAEKPWAHDAGVRALVDAVSRRKIDATIVSGGVPGVYRVKCAIHGQPLVSVVAVNTGEDVRSREAWLQRVRYKTAGSPVEVLVAGQEGFCTTREIHDAVRRSHGAHIVFLDAALEPANDEWLTALLEFSQQPAVGAVGGKLLYADGRLRHIGLLLGVGPGVGRAMHGQPATGYGYFSSSIGLRNYSAVSGECLMTRRDVFEAVGGLDEALPWNGADVDYCLRAGRAGFRIVFTPYAKLQIRNDATPAALAPNDRAIRVLRERWRASFDLDPYYNSNLSTRTPDYQLRD